MTDFDELATLARQALLTVKGYDGDYESEAHDALAAGEPIDAMETTLEIASEHPELFARFPQGMKDLSRDPAFSIIHLYEQRLNAS